MATTFSYRADIDGLRAVAVVPVILFHGGFQAFSGGFVGVDVFFVISGYLITSLILSELDAGNFTLRGFYERRARRILPALFLVAGVSVPFALLWLMPRDLVDFSQSLMAVSTFSSNILFWQEGGYFDNAAELKPLLHTWSLAAEEQYYVLFPLFILACRPLSRERTAMLLLLVCAASLLLALWGVSNKPRAAFFLLPTRGWEILAGSLAAFYVNRHGLPSVGRTFGESLGVGGLAAIAVAVLAYSEDQKAPGLTTVVPVGGAVLVILFSRPGWFVHGLLTSRALVGIGLVSYSAYLWHYPLYAFARNVVSFSPEPGIMAGLALSAFPLAYLSWRFVERPFRDRERFSRRTIFAAGLVGSLAIFSAGYAGFSSRGMEGRLAKGGPVGDVSHDTFHEHVARRYAPCTPAAIYAAALSWNGYVRCMQSRPDRAVDIALIGDSHAEHLFPGLAEALPDRNIVYYTRASPPFLSNADFRAIFDSVLGDENVKTVIVSANWEIIRGTSAERLRDELSSTVARLADRGKRVYLIDDVPRFPFGPEGCKWLRWPFDKLKCDMVRDLADEQESRYLPPLREAVAAVPDTRLIALRRFFCDTKICSMVKDGTLVFRDNNHLNVPGSYFAGARIAEMHPELKDWR